MSDEKQTPVPGAKKPMKAMLALIVGLLALGGLAVGFGVMNNKPAPDMESSSMMDDPADIAQTETTPELAPPAAPEPETDASSAEEPEMAVAETPAPAANGSLIDRAMTIRAVGNPAAPIKVIEFASLTCSHCAHFHNDTLPALQQKYIDNGQVYLEFREFPLNAPALDAALIARCLPPERYEAYTNLLFKTQEDWASKPDYIVSLKQNAKLAGLTEGEADTCLKSPKLRQFIASRVKEATDKFKLNATPTFIVNDGAEIIQGAMPLYEFERVFRSVSDGKIGAVDSAGESNAAETEPAASPEEDTPDQAE